MSQDKQPHSTHQADSIMLTLVLILAAFGLLILFSASEYNGRVRFHDSAYYFKKQLFATALGQYRKTKGRKQYYQHQHCSVFF